MVGNKCAAARRRAASSSSFLPCLFLAAALSAGCCRAHARSLLASFPRTTTSELEKEAGRYVDDNSEAGRKNKITNLQVSLVGDGHDAPGAAKPADGDAPFVDAAYPVKWSPRTDAPPKAPAISADQLNGQKAEFTDAAYPVKWSPRTDAPPKAPAIFAQHSNGDEQFTDAAYPVKWSPRNDAAPTPPTALASLAHPGHHRGIHIQQGMLFLMKKLLPGAVLPEGMKLAHDHGVAAAPPQRRFIYKDKADTVPFDFGALDTILAMFGILPGSEKASQVADTLRTCGELTAGGGEPRACATSHEAVLDFAASALGTSAPRAVTTLVHGRREPRRYVVAANGVARIGGDAVVPCHPMPYPYEVYYCHRPGDAVALRVDLLAGAGEDDDALGATAVAVCHVNTTTWDTQYFELLKASRGDAICHYMPQGYVVWLSN